MQHRLLAARIQPEHDSDSRASAGTGGSVKLASGNEEAAERVRPVAATGKVVNHGEGLGASLRSRDRPYGEQRR